MEDNFWVTIAQVVEPQSKKTNFLPWAITIDNEYISFGELNRLLGIYALIRGDITECQNYIRGKINIYERLSKNSITDLDGGSK